MDAAILSRLRENLLRQKDSLEKWLEETPEKRKRINLGPAAQEEAETHLQVLETAVELAESEKIGICEVCNDYVEPSRLELDYTASICIDHYSEEEKRKLESDLELAKKIQKALLPSEIPHLEGLQAAAFTQPARIVGGDYFDFFHYKDGAHGWVIADVMGKGMAASLLMASLQSSLRIIGPEMNSPMDIANRLNSLFRHNINLTKFVTLFLSRYNPATRKLEYCNAGHNPPLLLRSSEALWLAPTGAAIGLVENATFRTESILLHPGDVLILYTDGITEGMNEREEEFGNERLLELAREKATLHPADLLSELRNAIQKYTGSSILTDDVTLLAFKVQS